MDQTLLPFSFTNGGTYADTGDKMVWVRGGASGLEKRQCTAQITLFADEEPRVKPLLISKGKGKQISFREKVSRALSMLMLIIVLCYTQLQYDRRVIVTFQKNAWCDKGVMISWVCQQWKPACHGDMMLVLDVHRAQKTEEIQKYLRDECKTEPIFVPAGMTSMVQLVDVIFNRPFKEAIDAMANSHVQENLQDHSK